MFQIFYGNTSHVGTTHIAGSVFVRTRYGEVVALSLHTSPQLSTSNILDKIMADTNDSIQIEIPDPHLERLGIMLRSLAQGSHKNSKALAILQCQHSDTDSQNKELVPPVSKSQQK